MEIQSRQINIAEAFKNHYIIPQYQREYVWKDNNVQQLLDDIYSEYSGKNSSEYFIGSIVVWGEANNKFEVIDGQQRLTTLFIALCALANIHKENKDVSRLKYIELLLISPTYNSGNSVFDQHLILQYEDSNKILEILLRGADNIEIANTYLSSKNTKSVENIFKAYKFIKDYFAEKTQDDFLNFSDYFLHKVIFMQIKTPSISDALKIFETINERGVGLNPMDLLKNLIFMQLSSSDFEKLNSKWKSITGLLEKNKQKPLRFIRYFIMSNFIVKDASKEADVIREDEIYSWIKRHENECNYKKDPFGFVSEIQKNANSYVKFFNMNTDSRSVNLAIENIKNLGGPAFSQHYVMLLAAKELPEELFVYFINQVEKLILYYFVTKTQAKVWEAKFSRWADGLREVIKSNNQSSALSEFVNNYFIPEQERLENEFKSMFLNLRLDSLQKYKIKYILAKISKHVDSIRLGEKSDQGMSFYLKQEIEIEHILPNSPTKDLLDSFGGEEVYNNYKNKLGNLTLLEKPHNIVAGRESFSEKISLYEQSNFYLTRSIVKKEHVGNNSSVSRANELLIEFKYWSSNTIDQRQEMLLDLALDIWKIKRTNFLNSSQRYLIESEEKKERVIKLYHEKKYEDAEEERVSNRSLHIKNIKNIEPFNLLDDKVNYDDDLKNTKPRLFKFDGDVYNSESWIHLYIEIIKILYKKHSPIFENINSLDKFGRRPIILTHQDKRFNHPEKVTFKDGRELHIETNLNAGRIRKNLIKIYDFLGISKELIVEKNKR